MIGATMSCYGVTSSQVLDRREAVKDVRHEAFRIGSRLLGDLVRVNRLEAYPKAVNTNSSSLDAEDH